jgi:hypothetical protein
MAANSGAFGAKPGFNQSGGGYYVVVSTIAPAQLLQVVTAGSGSGGAYAQPVLSTNSWWTQTGYSSLSSVYLAAGRLLRDMGKTITSSSRTFRKFQLVAPRSLSTGGVTGNVGTSADTGYLDFYVEVPTDGSPTGNGVAIARTFF